MIARSPLIASCPAIAFAYCVCCVSLSPSKAFLRSCITVSRLFIFSDPSSPTVVRLMPSSSIASAASFGGAESLERILLRAVPDLVPLMPAFAMSPIATAASSIE